MTPKNYDWGPVEAAARSAGSRHAGKDQADLTGFQVRKRRAPGKSRLGHALGDFRMIASHVVRLRAVGDDVIKLGAAAVGVDEQLPRAVAHGHVGAAVAARRIAERFVVAAIFPEQRMLSRVSVAQQGGGLILAVERGVAGQSSPRPSAQNVGNKSTAATTVSSSTRPAGTCPGQRAINGRRMPPS